MDSFIIAYLNIDCYPYGFPSYGIVGLLQRINKVLRQIKFPLCLLEILFSVL